MTNPQKPDDDQTGKKPAGTSVGSVDEHGTFTPADGANEANPSTAVVPVTEGNDRSFLAGLRDINLVENLREGGPWITSLLANARARLPSMPSLPALLSRKTPATPAADSDDAVVQGTGQNLPAVIPPARQFKMPAALTSEGAIAKRTVAIVSGASHGLSAGFARVSPTEDARNARAAQRVVALSNGIKTADNEIKGIAEKGMKDHGVGKAQFAKLEKILGNTDLHPFNTTTALQGVADLGAQWPDLSKKAINIIIGRATPETLPMAARQIIAVTGKQRLMAETLGVEVLSGIATKLRGPDFEGAAQSIAAAANGVKANADNAFKLFKDVIENNRLPEVESPESASIVVRGLLDAMRSAAEHVPEGLKTLQLGINEDRLGDATGLAIESITHRAYNSFVPRATVKSRIPLNRPPEELKLSPTTLQAREVIADLMVNASGVRVQHAERVFSVIAATSQASKLVAVTEILELHDKIKGFAEPNVRIAATTALLPVAQEIAVSITNNKNVADRAASVAVLERIEASGLLAGHIKGNLQDLFAAAHDIDTTEQAYLEATSGYAAKARDIFKPGAPANTQP